MKRNLTAVILLLLCSYALQAQKRVFKEIGENYYSQIRTIYQDNQIIGYLVFTQLEKASADSFNYKITLMDENLNDIGTVKFREQKLFLHDVAFEQDILCLAYVKSNFIGHDFASKKDYKAALPNAKTSVFLQFLNLDGKIVKTNTIDADVQPEQNARVYASVKKIVGLGRLKYSIILKDIPKQGFAVFYADDRKRNLLAFSSTGNQLWKKNIQEDDLQAYWLLTTSQDVYFVFKKKQKDESGYEMLGYGIADSANMPKYTFKDKQGNALKLLNMYNDPVTGNPYFTGLIINPDRGTKFGTPAMLCRGLYAGLFTVNANGHKKGDINENFSYWIDESKPFISRKGRLEDTKTYVNYKESFKDYEGNTWFTGSSIQKHIRVGGIISSVIFFPTLYVPLWYSKIGYIKTKQMDPVFIKQTPKGVLTLETSIPGKKGDWSIGSFPMSFTDHRGYNTLWNSETKTCYEIIYDVTDIKIYNLNQKKVVRTISYIDGNNEINVHPAKEGHVMVVEYNKKSGETSLSIEAL